MNDLGWQEKAREATALTLTSYFESLDDLIDSDEERLKEVQDVGPIVASSVRAFFQESHNREVIRALVSAGLHWPDVAQKRKRSALKGQTFVITGTLSSMSRDVGERALDRLGSTRCWQRFKETQFVL